MWLKRDAARTVEMAREYVEAMLGLEVWSNNLFSATKAPAHAGAHAHEEGAHGL